MPYVAIEAAVLIVLCICVNLILLFKMQEMSLIALFAVTLIFLLLIFFLTPYYTRFLKITAPKKKPSGRTSAVHQHNSQKSVKTQQKSKNQTKK